MDFFLSLQETLVRVGNGARVKMDANLGQRAPCMQFLGTTLNCESEEGTHHSQLVKKKEKFIR